LLSELLCGSFLVYPPGDRATTKEARAIQKFIWLVKDDRPYPGSGQMAIEYAIEGLKKNLPGSVLEGFFDGAVLIPVPTSKKRPPEEPYHWPGRRLCRAMLAAGLGAGMDPCVVRCVTIKSSKKCAPDERPTVKDHLASMALEGHPCLDAPRRVILVDDLVTRGSTMLAAAEVARGRYPSSLIAGFALAATLMPDAEFSVQVDIRISKIRLATNGRGWRDQLTDSDARLALRLAGW